MSALGSTAPGVHGGFFSHTGSPTIFESLDQKVKCDSDNFVDKNRMTYFRDSVKAKFLRAG